MRRRRRLIVVVSVVLTMFGVGLYVLRHNGRPQTVTLDVAGDLGRKVVGFVTADGVK